MSLTGKTLDAVVGNPVGRRLLTTAVRTSMRLPAPDGSAAARARWTGHLLLGRGRPGEAAAVLATAERAERAPARRAELAAARALAELAAGHEPADLDDCIRGALALADDALGADALDADALRDSGQAEHADLDRAALRLFEALSLAFHPSRHFGARRSPLLAAPDDFMAPFRASRAFARLGASPAPRARRPRTRTRRLLVVAAGNFTFVRDIVADYRGTDGLEVRTLDLDDVRGLGNQLDVKELTRARLRRGTTGERLPVPESVAETLDWADTILVEWGHRALAWVSLLEGLDARIVARVHRYEALTPLPMLTDWSAVDDAVFISPAFRDVVRRTAPAVEGTRLAVVPNRADLAACRREKTPDAARTVALVGWDRMVKDPAWALDVLDRLRARDERWRLLLIGSDTPSEPWPEAREYFARVQERIDAAGGAVEVRGHTDDVPGALREVGVILSTSLQESAHVSLLQGVASGALPVVRDWPDLAGWGGPAELYPRDWVVTTPDEAAARVIAAGAEPHAGDAARTAQAWAVDNRDWAAVRPRFDAVVLGAEETP
ncbi:glycosyltransferase [Georgenia soli]|nr:glycosyltransferase [Georgenia soli]